MRAALNFAVVGVALATVLAGTSSAFGEPGSRWAKRSGKASWRSVQTVSYAKSVSACEPAASEPVVCSSCVCRDAPRGDAPWRGAYHWDPFNLRLFDSTVPLEPTYIHDPDIHQWKPWLDY